MRYLTTKYAVAGAISTIVVVLGVCSVLLVNARPTSQAAVMPTLPPAVAEERALIAADLRARPQLSLELRSADLHRDVRASDGTRMTVFSTRDAVVIQYGPHKFATVDYP